MTHRQWSCIRYVGQNYVLRKIKQPIDARSNECNNSVPYKNLQNFGEYGRCTICISRGANDQCSGGDREDSYLIFGTIRICEKCQNRQSGEQVYDQEWRLYCQNNHEIHPSKRTQNHEHLSNPIKLMQILQLQTVPQCIMCLKPMPRR